MSFQELIDNIRAEIRKVVYGQEAFIDMTLAALLSCGHVLLEGVPGTAKTLLVRTIAATLNMDWRRVQMTPDLLPGDILGSSVYNSQTNALEFRPGPIFSHFLIVDEINRASARTQSALLEAMQELQVTYDGKTHLLPDPFMVFATQNPIEQEGTYPLPLAQLDRFMVKLIIDYPDPDTEERILKEHHATGLVSLIQDKGVQPVVGPGEILEARELIRQTTVREQVVTYVQRLAGVTREADNLQVGASPRAALMLLLYAKAMARLDGRDFVTPDDVKEAFLPVMRHRVVLSPTAELEGVTPDNALRDLMDFVEVPR